KQAGTRRLGFSCDQALASELMSASFSSASVALTKLDPAATTSSETMAAERKRPKNPAAREPLLKCVHMIPPSKNEPRHSLPERVRRPALLNAKADNAAQAVTQVRLAEAVAAFSAFCLSAVSFVDA